MILDNNILLRNYKEHAPVLLVYHITFKVIIKLKLLHRFTTKSRDIPEFEESDNKNH